MERYSRDTVVVTTAEINELAANKALDPTVEYWVDRNRFAYAPDRETIKYLVEGGGSALPTAPVQVTTSRNLASSDNGLVLECTATVTLTVPASLPAGFRCVVIPSGTTSVAFTGTTGNGAATTITRAASANANFGIVQRGSNANSYVLDGV